MNKNLNNFTMEEFNYIKKCNERNIAKILQLDQQSIVIRHELEIKRRGFSLIAELASALARYGDYDNIFVVASKRINAVMNMQRTVVLVPQGGDIFKASVISGYDLFEEEEIIKKSIHISADMLQSTLPVIINCGDGSHEAFQNISKELNLPHLIFAPIAVSQEVSAILITGRMDERPPYLLPLSIRDIEIIQTISAFLGAVLVRSKLEEAEKLNKIMIDALPICCALFNSDGTMLECNESAAKMFMLDDKNEFETRFFELAPTYQPDGSLSSEASINMVKEAFITGYKRFEWMHKRVDGLAVPTEVTLVKVSYGRKELVAAYVQDLTEYKAHIAAMVKKEEELRIAKNIAEKSAKAKTEFLANMSHEIRTPMNAIIGITHILMATELSDKQRKYLDQSLHSAQLLLSIIDDVLDFSKIDAGKIVLDKCLMSVRKMIYIVEAMLKQQIGGKEVRLRTKIEDNVPDHFMADTMRIEQVLLNLGNNAIKFTSEGFVDINVSLKEISGNTATLLFSVQDTGIGIDKPQLEKLFTPFMQADSSATRKYGGTGLGLAISKGFVDIMGGKISCESEFGKGSRFFFELPLEMTEAAYDIENIILKKKEDYDFSGLKVLLAEDNEINRMVAQELLEASGMELTTVSDGKKAVEAVLSNDFDLVLMDIQMPEMDGLEATKKIRQYSKFARLPIIAMTAHALSGDKEISLGAGMNDHVTKPIDPPQLYGAIEKWRNFSKS